MGSLHLTAENKGRKTPLNNKTRGVAWQDGAHPSRVDPVRWAPETTCKPDFVVDGGNLDDRDCSLQHSD